MDTDKHDSWMRQQYGHIVFSQDKKGSTKGCGYEQKSSLAQQSLLVVLRNICVRLIQTFQEEWSAHSVGVSTEW